MPDFSLLQGVIKHLIMTVTMEAVSLVTPRARSWRNKACYFPKELQKAQLQSTVVHSSLSEIPSRVSFNILLNSAALSTWMS